MNGMNGQWKPILVGVVALAILLMDFESTFGQETRQLPAGKSDVSSFSVSALASRLPNLQTKTLGGMQYWTDELVFHDWRIQRNALTNHYRLLDGDNVRHAWGSFVRCERILEQIKRQKDLPPMDGKVIVLLHGLMRSRHSMAGLRDYLRANSRYQVVTCSYASSRDEIGEHAAALKRVLARLPDAQELYLVGHSLGNLVIRHYWADHTDAEQLLRPDARIRRIVMLAPPNNHPRLARIFEDSPVMQLAWGESGAQIAEWDELQQHLATPTCPFGIIAGAAGKNLLLSGENDLVLSVAETRLAGADDFLVLPVRHTFLMNDLEVQQCVLRFIDHGFFVSAHRRHPL